MGLPPAPSNSSISFIALDGTHRHEPSGWTVTHNTFFGQKLIMMADGCAYGLSCRVEPAQPEFKEKKIGLNWLDPNFMQRFGLSRLIPIFVKTENGIESAQHDVDPNYRV